MKTPWLDNMIEFLEDPTASRSEDVDHAIREFKNIRITLRSIGVCTIIKEDDDLVGNIPVTSCCLVGPITKENFCPNCGKLIERDGM